MQENSVIYKCATKDVVSAKKAGEKEALELSNVLDKRKKSLQDYDYEIMDLKQLFVDVTKKIDDAE